MDVYHAIRSKRALRHFSGEPLPQDAMERILNAGRLAQSAKNQQPWHFIAIRDRGTLQSLSELGHFAGHLSGAALGVAILTPPPAQRFSILFDAGQAAAYMQLAAWEIGIASCLATIYQPDEARALLGFPEELQLHIAISFGYPHPDEHETRPARKAGRRQFGQVVHWERWGSDLPTPRASAPASTDP